MRISGDGEKLTVLIVQNSLYVVDSRIRHPAPLQNLEPFRRGLGLRDLINEEENLCHPRGEKDQRVAWRSKSRDLRASLGARLIPRSCAPHFSASLEILRIFSDDEVHFRYPFFRSTTRQDGKPRFRIILSCVPLCYRKICTCNSDDPNATKALCGDAGVKQWLEQSRQPLRCRADSLEKQQ